MRARSDLEEQARDAVAQVHDPEIHRPLPELGMLGGITVRRSGVLEIEVILTTDTCPLREKIAADVRKAVSALPGVREVRVRFGAMSQHDRASLADRLPGGIASAGPLSPDGPSIYAVASGKGGVGKSVTTANLAAALAASGSRVGLLDADVWGYSIPKLFGVRRNPVALPGVMLPVPAHGVRLMSVGFLVEDDEPVVWRGPMLHKALEQFLGDVHWGELDILLLDLPPGTGDVTLTVLELLSNAALLVVTTPQQTATSVASRVGRMARDAGMPIAGVVENMSAFACEHCGAHTAVFGSGGGAWLADALGTSLLGRIPLDDRLRVASDAGLPVVVQSPTAPSATALSQIAQSLPVIRPSLQGRALPLSVV